MADGLGRLSAGLNRLAMAGAVLAVFTMLAAALWQVLARYLLDAPPIWTEELSRRAMVWAGMLGASCAFHAAADPTLFPGMRARTGAWGGLLALVRASGVILFAAPVLWYSLFNAQMDPTRGFLGRSLSRTAEMIPVSMIWFTAAVPIAFTLILIHLAARLARRAAGEAPEAAAPVQTPQASGERNA